MKKLCIFLALFALCYLPNIFFPKLGEYLYPIASFLILIVYIIISFKKQYKLDYHMGLIWTFIPLIHGIITYLIDNATYTTVSVSSALYFVIGVGILLVSGIFNFILREV